MNALKKVGIILALVFLGVVVHAQVVKDTKWKYQSGSSGDGFIVSLPESYIEHVSYEEQICEGGNFLATVSVNGGSLFAYKWYEEGKEGTVLSVLPSLQFANCGYDAYNGKKYFCKVRDLNTDVETVISDPVVINIVKFPIVKVTPATDVTLCYGETVQLKATPAGSSNFYTWEGDGVISPANTDIVTVKPQTTTLYTVTVSVGTCAASASVKVNVKKPEVKLPEDIVYVGGNGSVSIAPIEMSSGAQLDWNVGGHIYTNKNPLVVTLDEITSVKVTLKDGTCPAVDSCVVIPEKAFERYKSGDDDGFVQSIQKMVIAGVQPGKLAVCKGETAYFTVNVKINSTYTFQWWKSVSGADTKITGANDKILTIPSCDEGDVADYYCVVKDQDSKEEVVTEKVKLSVSEVPTIAILSPRADTTICEGKSIVLKANRGLADGETFKWAGYDIKTNSGLREITVQPSSDTSIYELVVDNGVCRSSAERKVIVKRVSVDIPDVKDVLRGESVKFELEPEAGVTYAWSMNGVTQSTGTKYMFTPTENCMVRILKKDKGCPITDSCQIFVKDFGVGVSPNQDDDGYTESVLSFNIKSIDCPKKICENERAVLNIEVNGYDIYEYTWKKRVSSGEDIVANTKTYEILNVRTGHSGKYFCEVRDVRSGKVLISEDVEMSVLKVPVAEIEEPGGTVKAEICRGDKIELRAFSAGAGCTYLWEGQYLTGSTNKLIASAQPDETTNYSVTVSNGVCSSTAYVEVAVKNITVTIPEVLYTNSGSILEIKPTPAAPAGSSLTWKWGGQETTGPEFRKNITASTVVAVQMDYNGCPAKDSCRVYVKNTYAYRSGDEDGFTESELSFRILKLEYLPVVCENADADFSVRLSGSGLYTYAWRRVGAGGAPLSEENTFRISSCPLNMSGARYYCEVTDLQIGKTLVSDTVTLNVQKGPKAVIGYPEHGKQYCIGSVVRLDARKTEESKDVNGTEFSYSWEGENIQRTERDYIVDVKPTSTQVYTLKVAVAGCVDYDTITVGVINPKVDIPSVAYVKEGENLVLNALVNNTSVNAKVNWWHNAKFIPNTNPFTSVILESAVVVAEVEDKGCKSTDTARVFLRTKRFFQGGADDGFMESCETPVIVPGSSNTVLGCGGVDSVSMVVNFSGSVKVFKWQKYNDLTGSFETIATAASNMSGLGTGALTINPVQTGDYGEYRCVLNNDCGYVYSYIYTLANGLAPELEEVADTVTFCEGVKNQHVLITVKGDKDEMKYRWYKKNPVTGITEQFKPETVYNSNFLEFSEITTEADALYIAEVENSCGIVKDSIRMLVTRKVAIQHQPSDTIVCVNTPVSLKIFVRDGGIKSFVLKKVQPDASQPLGYKVLKELVGNGSDVYNFASVTRADDGYYVWNVVASCGQELQSKMFHMSVENPPQFTYQSPDSTYCYGAMAVLKVEATSPDCPTSKLEYSWEKQDVGALAYKVSEVVFPFQENSDGAYICKVKNSCPAVVLTTPIVLKAHPSLVLKKQPILDQAGYCEDSKKLAIEFEVNLPAVVDSIRWYKTVGNVTDLVVDVPKYLSGASTSKLCFDSLRLEDAGYYRAKAFYVCGIIEPARVNVVVNEKAKIIKPITDFIHTNLVCQGDEATLKVEARGKESLNYLWLINNNVVHGANTESLKVRFDSSATYECHVQNYCGDSYSRITVNIIKVDTFRLQAVGGSHYCADKEGVKLRLAGSDTNYIYRLHRVENNLTDMVRQLSGKDASYVGGSLDFGFWKKGKYHVVAKHKKNLCEGIMPGEITVIEDTLPTNFNFVITRPICTGDIVGCVALDSSIYTIDGTFQYSLHYKLADGSWKRTGAVKVGTGDSLYWDNVVAATYKVLAKNQSTGCEVWSNEQELKERPLPVLCSLSLSQGDSIFCEGVKQNIVLKLKDDCLINGLTYTLKKNGILTDRKLTGAPAQWDNIEPGKYSVKVENQWGCSTETNKVNIKELPLPAKKLLSKNRYFCSGEVGTHTLSVAGVDEKIRYDFFKVGVATPFASEYKGSAYTFVSTDVALKNDSYYVIATDTASGCNTEMTNRVFVKEGKLKLSNDPVSVDKSEAQVTLNLKVENAIGTPKITWKPAIQIIDESDPLRPVMDISDMTKNVFEVTVKDSACTKTLNITVIFTGVELAAHIKSASDCRTEIPKDTVYSCYGDSYSLCGTVVGGNGSYIYEWKQNDIILGTGDKLTDITADASGYVYFSVTSGGRTALDSVWLEVYPQPGKDLEMNEDEKICAVPGENIEIKLKKTQTDVSYSLLFSKTGESYTACGVTKTGTVDGDLTLSYLFDKDNKIGYYRVKASKSYNGKTCPSEHGVVQVIRGVVRGTISGGGEYCDRIAQDTILLDTTDVKASYRLLYKAEGDAEFQNFIEGGLFAGTGDTLRMVGNWPNGTYKVVAEKEGVDCVTEMNGEVKVKRNPKPAIGKLESLQEEYCLVDGETLNVAMTLTNCIPGNSYKLFRQTSVGTAQVGSTLVAHNGDFVFGTDFSTPGKYYALAYDGTCISDTAGFIRIASVPTDEVVLVVADTGYCAGDGSAKVSLSISPIDPALHYYIYAVGSESPVGEFGEFVGNTAKYTGDLSVGEYILKTVIGECSVTVARSFKVEEYSLPKEVSLFEPVTSCAGTDLTMGVKNSEIGILYELFRKVDDGIDFREGFATGDGNDLQLGILNTEGHYYVRAENTTTNCHRNEGSYDITPAPKKFDFIAIDTAYCPYRVTDGAQLGLSGTQKDISYFLQRYNDDTRKFEDLVPLVSIYGSGVNAPSYFDGKFNAGKYRVRTNTCGDVLMGTEIEVIERKLPDAKLLVDIKGNACVDSTITLVLKNAETGTTYSLWKENVQKGSSVTGSGADKDWTISSLKQGVYEIRAEKETCKATLQKQVSVNDLPEIGNLAGENLICENAVTELQLTKWRQGTDYILVDKIKIDTTYGEVSNGEQVFKRIPVGTYYAVGAKGDCKIHSGDFTIKGIRAPKIEDVKYDFTECMTDGKGSIIFHKMSDTLIYNLTYPDKTVNKLIATVVDEERTLSNLKMGEYFLEIQGTGTSCRSLTDTIVLKNQVPVGDTIIGNFGFCAGEEGARLRLRSSSLNVKYYILDYTTRDVIDSLYNNGEHFSKSFLDKKYIFHSVREKYLGGCSFEDTITIKKYGEPDLNKVITVQENTALCEGNEYHIIVKDAAQDVAYILRRDGLAIDTLRGVGDKSFKPVKLAGYYTVLPLSGGLCGSDPLEKTIVINRLPGSILAEDGFYCNAAGSLDEKGWAIQLSDVRENVDYVLVDKLTSKDKDTIAGDISVPYITFEPMPAGTYYVRAEDKKTMCHSLVDSVEITKGEEPFRFVVGEDGQRCGQKVEIATSDGGAVAPVEYYLYYNGKKIDGPKSQAAAGNISFGEKDVPGVYTIFAQEPGGCGVFMKDSIVIYAPLIMDTLDMRGSYCENQLSDIRLVLKKSVLQWRYYIEKDSKRSDTLAGQADGALRWESVGGEDIRSGKYTLFALDPCGNTTKMDTLMIEPRELPVRQSIVEGDYTLCSGDSKTITLNSSEVGVSYELVYIANGSQSTVATKVGTGGKLEMGLSRDAGIYKVFGSNILTGCRDTMSYIQVKTIPGIEDPGISGDDICLGTGAGQLVISLTTKDDQHISYYLHRIKGTDTTEVDAIKIGLDDLEKYSFNPQTEVGNYLVLAKGPSCQKYYKGARIGDVPAEQELDPVGQKNICEGSKVELCLKNSEENVDYEVYAIQISGLDSTVVSTGVVVAGTGNKLIVDSLAVSGRYIVKASNGCVRDMKGELKVNVTSAYKIKLQEGGYTICNGDSVKIDILGVTNPNPNAKYIIYPPGTVVGSNDYLTEGEMLIPGRDGASVQSVKWYKKAGYYRIYGTDNSGCKELDSVKVELLKLPLIYDIKAKGNLYICDSEKKQIVLSGNQPNVNYYLCRKVGDKLENVTMKAGGVDELVFEVTQEGVYVVMAEVSEHSQACRQQMNGEITFVDKSKQDQFKLEAVVSEYCAVAGGVAGGSVKLVNSAVDMEYQLYKDGLAYGDPQIPAVVGNPVIWNKLPGGMPKMSNTQTIVGTDYTVVGINKITGCRTDMLGSVKIIGERSIQFNDQYMETAMPKCIGEQLRMEILAYGGKISYVWKKDNNAISGANNYYYLKEKMTAQDIGQYYCVMKNTCGIDSTRKLKVEPRLLLEKDPGKDTITVCDLAVDEMRSQRLISSVRNATSWTWKKDGNLIAGAIEKWIDVKISRTSGAGMYTCAAMNPCGSLIDTVYIMVDSVPQITPSIVKIDTLCQGTNYVLSVSSNYPPEWLKGSDKLNLTGNTLTVNDIKAVNAGVYYAWAHNGCGEKKVKVGTLLVDEPVTVISSLEPQSLCRSQGELGNLFVETKPKERVSYRWEDAYGKVLSKTNELNDIDLSKYSSNEEKFRVYYANKCTDNHADIKLQLSDVIRFTNPEEEIKICVDGNALKDTVLRVKVDNPKDVIYKWYRSRSNAVGNIAGTDGLRDSVGNTETLKIKLNSGNSGLYYCYMSNRCTDTTTRTTSLRVDTVPQLLSNLPLTKSVCSGTKVELSMLGKGGSVGYSWYIRKKKESAPASPLQKEILFAEAESKFAFTPDTNYNGAKVWCDISNTCGKLSSDTLILTVLPAPIVEMTPPLSVLCEGHNAEIVLKLTKGQLPWEYKYSVNGEELAEVKKVTKETDTLKVKAEGVYRVVYLKDNTKCEATGASLASAELKLNKVSEVKMVIEGATDGKIQVCPGQKVEFKVTIGGTVPGPWNLEILRKLDATLATELGFSDRLFTTQREHTFTLIAQESKTYFVHVTNVMAGGAECDAKVTTLPVTVEVKQKPVVTMNILTPEQRKQSICNNVDLETLFNVQPADGWYTVNGKEQNGGWLLKPGEKYDIGYSLLTNNCQFDYDLDKIEFMPRPTVTLSADRDFLCAAGAKSNISISATGQYPVFVNYRLSNLMKDGRVSLQTTVTDRKFTNTDPLKVSIEYEEDIFGKIIEVTRAVDMYNCAVEKIELLKDTVLSTGRPEFTLYAKKSEDAEWYHTQSMDFSIRKGDVVEVKAELTKGFKPWLFQMTWNIDKLAVDLKNIKENEVSTSLKEAGLYEALVQDKYCMHDEFSYKPSINIKVIDTAFLKLKVMLEGPWNAITNKMESTVLGKIDKRGLSAWPNVGSKSIIDWIEVELWREVEVSAGVFEVRDTIPWDAISCLLLDDGTIVDVSGNDNLKMIGKGGGKYRVALRPRNHLAVWSKGVSLSSTTKQAPLMVDFTQSANIYVPSDRTTSDFVKVDNNGRILLYGGEVNTDRLISSFDPNRITREVLSLDLLQGPGQLLLDVNYNGEIEWPGFNKDGANDDWMIMYRNRIRFTLVPERKINW